MKKGSTLNRKSECHPERPHFCKGLCLECYRKDYDRQRYLNNIEKTKERTAEYKKLHPDKVSRWGLKYRTKNEQKEVDRHKIYNKNNSEKISERAKKYRENNKDKVVDRHRRYYINNPEKEREKRLRQYGITTKDYDRMFDEQKGLCAICGNDNKGNRLHVDHDHLSGKVRQLLCNSCNIGIGMLKDNIDILNKAITYLRKHKNG